jgi:hypothetical protein
MTHGQGRILAEWGSLEVHNCCGSSPVTGQGVYDVVFGVSPNQFLHLLSGRILAENPVIAPLVWAKRAAASASMTVSPDQLVEIM